MERAAGASGRSVRAAGNRRFEPNRGGMRVGDALAQASGTVATTSPAMGESGLTQMLGGGKGSKEPGTSRHCAASCVPSDTAGVPGYLQADVGVHRERAPP
jgi:hypothetical protein